MMKKINIVKMIRTCYICPSQWDAFTSNGKQLYIRYRYGMFSVAITDTNTGERRTIIEVELDENKYPEPMKEETVKQILSKVFNFDNCEYEFKD